MSQGPIMPDGSNAGPVEPGSDPIGFFIGGRAPQCATQAKYPTYHGTQFESVDTTLGPDGHPYFAVWLPVDNYSDSSFAGLQPIEALDDRGAIVGIGSGDSGWRSDEC